MPRRLATRHSWKPRTQRRPRGSPATSEHPIDVLLMLLEECDEGARTHHLPHRVTVHLLVHCWGEADAHLVHHRLMLLDHRSGAVDSDRHRVKVTTSGVGTAPVA
jgi:hypothetical protein